MAKTRRKKINRSPQRPYPTATAHIIDKGDTVTTMGVRGRTKVVRVIDNDGKRVTSVRSVAVVPQVAAKGAKAKRIFVGRVYTGVARGFAYPTGAKRGGPGMGKDILAAKEAKRAEMEKRARRDKKAGAKAPGIIARAAKAVKKVIVGENRA